MVAQHCVVAWYDTNYQFSVCDIIFSLCNHPSVCYMLCCAVLCLTLRLRKAIVAPLCPLPRPSQPFARTYLSYRQRQRQRQRLKRRQRTAARPVPSAVSPSAISPTDGVGAPCVDRACVASAFARKTTGRASGAGAGGTFAAAVRPLLRWSDSRIYESVIYMHCIIRYRIIVQ